MRCWPRIGVCAGVLGMVGCLVGCAGGGGAGQVNEPASERGEVQARDSEHPAGGDGDTSTGGEEPPELPKAPPVSEVGFDFHVWAADHQLETSLESDGCEPANLGAKPGDVIWCLHHVETKDGIVSYSRALYTARFKKLVKLVDVPYAVGPMDNDEQKTKESDRYKLKLVFERSSDGKRVELREAPGLDCTQAEKENEDNKGAWPLLYKAYSAAIKKICQQRGSWQWTGATLVHGGH